MPTVKVLKLTVHCVSGVKSPRSNISLTSGNAYFRRDIALKEMALRHSASAHFTNCEFSSNRIRGKNNRAIIQHRFLAGVLGLLKGVTFHLPPFVGSS
jgi:hypothetical protein